MDITSVDTGKVRDTYCSVQNARIDLVILWMVFEFYDL